MKAFAHLGQCGYLFSSPIKYGSLALIRVCLRQERQPTEIAFRPIS